MDGNLWIRHARESLRSSYSDSFDNLRRLLHGVMDLVINTAFNRNWVEIEAFSSALRVRCFVSIDFYSATFRQRCLWFVAKQDNPSNDGFFIYQKRLLFQPHGWFRCGNDFQHELDNVF